MPFVTVDNTRLFYRLEGSDEKPLLALAHSIGADHGLWDPQVPDLLSHFRILRFDSRGHGVSDAPSGDYSIERLGRDVLGMADALGIGRFAFCGLSLGGMVGQWLGVNAADRLTHLVLANTSPHLDPSFWQARRETAISSGMAAIADVAAARWFSPGSAAAGGAHACSMKRTLVATDPRGYTGCCAAIRDMNLTPLLGRIGVPTLVIAGEQDVATPWEGHGEVLAREIPGARAVRLAAGHISNVERPRSFTSALLDFLLPGAAGDPLEAGSQVRRAMLGDAHVDRSIAQATEFTRGFQELITRFAWGTIWARPGLDRRTRRLLTLAVTAALGRWEEFRLHVRSGLARELEPCDLEEALLHVAVYAGMPAANTAFHIAGEETCEHRLES